MGSPRVSAWGSGGLSPRINHDVRPSRKARSLRDRDGCRSLRSAFASIWRMRSRVTAKFCPTSSSVCSLPSPTPKRILITFSSRGVEPRLKRALALRLLRQTPVRVVRERVETLQGDHPFEISMHGEHVQK